MQACCRPSFYQQLPEKAAEAIFGRVKALGATGFPTPEEILRAPKTKLRRAGLSRQKIAAVRDLAAKTLDGTVPPLAKIRRMSEEEIHERLTRVHGIGEWSVQMFLMSRLGRARRPASTRLRNSKGFPAGVWTQGRPQTSSNS